MPSIWIAYCISVIRRCSHAGVEGDRVANPAVPGSWFRSRQSREPRSIQRNAIAKGANGEPAVLPGVLIVVCGLISKETELHAKGAFAIDSPPPGTSQIEANASGLYPALTVAAGAGTSSTIPVDKNVSAVTSTTSTQLTQLEAMRCASSRKMHRYA